MVAEEEEVLGGRWCVVVGGFWKRYPLEEEESCRERRGAVGGWCWAVLEVEGTLVGRGR